MVFSSEGHSKHAMEWREAPTDCSGRCHLLLLLQVCLACSCNSCRKGDRPSCINVSHARRRKEGVMRRVPGSEGCPPACPSPAESPPSAQADEPPCVSDIQQQPDAHKLGTAGLPASLPSTRCSSHAR